MLRIRLSRTGRKKLPTYRIVVAEHARPVKGKNVEVLGFFNPTTDEFELKKDRVAYWVSVGAKPSQTAARLFKKNGVEGMDKFIKYVNFVVKPKEETEEAAPAAAPVAEQAAESPAEETVAEESKEEVVAETEKTE